MRLPLGRLLASASGPIVLAVLVAALVRAPFWSVAARTATDGDTAIVGLMARHLGVGLTLWGQPYGSPLDAWVAAPFVGVLGPTRLAVRLPYFLLSLALVPLTAALARRVEPAAAAPAALLAACPPAYALLLSALPPPLYPTTLVLLAAALLLALDAGADLARGGRPAGRLVAWGLLSGLALWTHLMALAVVAATAVLLAVRGGRRVVLLAGLGALLLASAPAWTRALGDASATSVLGIAHEGRPPLEHARAVAARLHEPVLGILGAHAPFTADDPARRVDAPPLAVVAILALDAVGLGAAAWRRRSAATALLFATLLLTVAAFPFPVRSGPETLRFLSPALAPALALVASGWMAVAGRRRGGVAVAALAAAHLAGGWALARAWRDAAEPLVPDCADARGILEREGVRRAFASYNTAYCLTFESGERIVASQPWNERFYGHPLPYLDEVRFARDVAWVLVDGADFGLPGRRTFEAKLAGIGSRHRRAEAGATVVYSGFVPPFPATVRPGAVGGPAGDGDVATRILNPAGGPATVPLTSPLAVSAVTVVAGRASALPASLDLEVSSDGASFERVGRRRRARATVDLVWANGHPEFADDVISLTVPLDGRVVRAVRLVPLDQGQPWSVAEVLIHPPGPVVAPWPDWLPVDLSWPERIARLEGRPRIEDVGWYLRQAHWRPGS